ncbi:restriction endonuclease subunit S [Bacillus sp. Au-Bac7]|uniref:restriction endonuclease subunit S n=1 Tax=Bacillus sp. Au-Bac7 TaxID=2906458 RepID=UPI001E52FC99|nr:restriction endonuclease subunit S [Bacillus sp. Au-Bac7]MCE4051947.1 restriction endonuclease subunit S [Bacillus sp. Au-Bac7]
MAKIGELFDIQYGNSFALNQLNVAEQGISFVSRTSKNNGVSAIVEPIEGIKPFPPGLITVALSSMSVLETNVQPYSFYTGYHVAVLTPKNDMSINEKVYYCLCIEKNKYRYYFGRQANRTLAGLEVPDAPPIWINQIDVDSYNQLDNSFLNKEVPNLDILKWKSFRLSSIFNVYTGKGPLIRDAKKNPGNIPAVSATQFNNGIVTHTNYDSELTHPGNVLTLAKNGSVGEVFYQSHNFVATSDVLVLEPKFNFNVYHAMFLIPIIKKQRHKYNYGRKWNKEDLENAMIPLPAKDNSPDFMYMEHYIKTLKFSKSL